MNSTNLETTTTLMVPIRIAAEMLGFSERSLWTLTAPRGPIPVVRPHGTRTVRYSVEALKAWVAKQQSVETEGVNNKGGAR
jgi:predicted DNA-binding transcriptional regulator AlpA